VNLILEMFYIINGKEWFILFKFDKHTGCYNLDGLQHEGIQDADLSYHIPSSACHTT